MKKLTGRILDIDIRRTDTGMFIETNAILTVKVNTTSFNGIDPMKRITITQEEE